MDGRYFGFVTSKMSAEELPYDTVVERTHVGLMLVIFSPDLDLTNSLFMKSPMGCLYSRPLGALRLMKSSEVMVVVFVYFKGVTIFQL